MTLEWYVRRWQLTMIARHAMPPSRLLMLLILTLLSSLAGAAEPLNARLTDFEYPHPVKFLEVESQGERLEMAYMDIQPEKDAHGETVMLLHGKNFSGYYWVSTIAELYDRGYRVVIPDQIGFGKSSKPVDFQYSLHLLADFTRRLLDELEVERIHVVGHSMGGMLATRFVLMFPVRSRSLVLVNPIGLEDWKRHAPYQTVDQWYEGQLKQKPEDVKEYMKRSSFDGKWKPEYDPLLALQQGWMLGPDREHMAMVSALTYEMIFTQPVLYEFQDIKTSTLLIIGQRDRTAIGRNLAPPEVAEKLGRYDKLGKRAQQAIPNAKLVELKGVGHAPQYEAFDEYIQALVGFIERE